MKHQPTKIFAMADQIRSNFLSCMLVTSCLGAAMGANAQNLNGTLDSAFYGTALSVQTINTQFGNNAGPGDASTGSELDAVYAKVSGGNLYLFIAGCFQNNGNHVNVFVAGGGTGQNTLSGVTGDLAPMNGSVFPAGFNATWAFDANDSGGTFYYNEYTLTGTPAGGYVGNLVGTAGIFSGNAGGQATLYLNNTLNSTMGAATEALSGSNVGSSVTNGLEMVIPTSAIGYTGGSVNVLVDINGGGNGYLSNQFLPGLAVGTGNLGTSTFNLGPVPPPTNHVTFQVDMSAQVVTGVFTNGSSAITVSGSFEGWDNGLPLTNNPAAPDTTSNIYSGTFDVVGFKPTTAYYKYRANGGWEDDQPTATKNRESVITNATQVLPLVFYNNASLSDLITSPTWVHFSLHCPDGTLDNGGFPFVKGYDPLFVNGNFFNGSGAVVPAGTGSYWTWNTIPYPSGSGPASCQLFESEIPDVYTNSFLLPAGSKINITYKYSQDGFDDENGFQTNHIRYIRSVIPAPYSLPQDAWSWTVCPPGTAYPNPGIASTNIVEPSFGYLQIGAPSGSTVPLTWLGRQAVVVQHKSTLNGVWITDEATDGLQGTSYANTGDNQFFRLMKKP
jgi:hypothetical protein